MFCGFKKQRIFAPPSQTPTIEKGRRKLFGLLLINKELFTECKKVYKLAPPEAAIFGLGSKTKPRKPTRT